MRQHGGLHEQSTQQDVRTHPGNAVNRNVSNFRPAAVFYSAGRGIILFHIKIGRSKLVHRNEYILLNVFRCGLSLFTPPLFEDLRRLENQIGV